VALRWLLSEQERGLVLSELRELWDHRVERYGEAKSRRWYARQVRSYPLRLLRDRFRRGRLGQGKERDGMIAQGGVLSGLGAEARHAFRIWTKSPVLALTIVLTVGLGLGASTAMFAVVRVVLMDPLPYDGAGRLVRIYHAVGGNRWNISVADYQAIETQQTHFEGVAAYSSSERTLTTEDVVERVRVRAVTAGWFDLMGVQAARGRTFEASDGNEGGPRTAVLSWRFWQSRFGADASAIGRLIHLDGRDHRVIGVLPREVGPLEERIDVFPALQFAPPTRKGPFNLTMVGRLRRGIDPAVAEAELRVINKRIFPIWQAGWQDSTATWGMMPLDEFVVGRFRPMLLLLFGAVGVVLLVASANAAGLLTARAIQRRAELATRAALGASGSRLARLLITESLLLACGGALMGLGIAAVAIRVVRTAGPDLLPRAGQVAMDGSVLAFAVLLTGLSLVIFGVIPALQLLGRRAGIAQTLRSAGRTASGDSSAQRMRRVLVASQFAIAVPLLAGAALLLNSFLRLNRVDPGFDGEGVLTARLARTGAFAESPAEAVLFWDELLARVSALPGVTAAGFNNGRPPDQAADINNFDLLDRPTPPGESEPTAVWLVASPGFFDALDIRLVSGRMFDERDNADSDFTAALVDRTWANRMYPGEDPIGKRMYEGGCRAADCSIVHVVGIVDDVRYLGLDDSQTGAAVGTVYVPQSQWIASSTNLYVRAQGDPLALLEPIRAIVRELDPAVPITAVTTATKLVDDALLAPRNLTAAVIGFAAVALILAMIGIYGVMNYFVNEHRKDIGIRLALGGKPAAVFGLVLGRGLKPVAAGTLIGFAIAMGVTRFIAGLLYGVSPRDATTLAIVAFAMFTTAALACWLPARAAARLDPARVLRLD
jgi:putative ABC transport system permease protein